MEPAWVVLVIVFTKKLRGRTHLRAGNFGGTRTGRVLYHRNQLRILGCEGKVAYDIILLLHIAVTTPPGMIFLCRSLTKTPEDRMYRDSEFDDITDAGVSGMVRMREC